VSDSWMWIVVGLIVVSVFVANRFVGRKDSSEAHRLVSAGAALIDVRTPAEFAGGHIEGAVNIPVDQLARRSGEIGAKDRPVVVYCRSGSRSAAAAATLRQLGYATVEDLGAKANW
jgi:phage shock protein E